MKFGKNLAQLLIPQWRCYNLDYNELKAHIRRLLDSPNPDPQQLQALYTSFVENFDYVNLFINTKASELARKLKYYETQYLFTEEANIPVVEKCMRLNDLQYQVMVDVSVELKRLIKFIIIQKVALKKIFKKFLKYSPFEEETSQAFVHLLKQHLNSNPKSFTRYDLLYLTASVTGVMYNVRQLTRALNKNDEPQLNNNSLHFDLTAILKKNFVLDFLVPSDPNSSNELLLHLDIYIGLKAVSASDISFIYLTSNKLLDEAPYSSFILSHLDQPTSVVVAYTGGLRKYSYCVLKNTIVTKLIDYLQHPSGKLEAEIKKLIEPSLSHLTKLTLDTIVNNDLKPSAKLVCKRRRYFVSRDEAANDDSDDAVSRASTKKTEDDYLVQVDSDIATTNHPRHFDLSFDSTAYDKFPFSHVMVCSNDSNLHNFEQNLQTSLDADNVLNISYRPTYLHKLPPKIQQLVKNNFSLSLFKNLSFYEYLRSCYWNRQPSAKYSHCHYSKLLNLNLLKNLENVTEQANLQTLEDEIIEDKSNQYLRRQQSFRSVSSFQSELIRPPTSQKNNSIVSVDTHGSIFTQNQVSDPSFLEFTPPLQSDVINASEDNYMLFLKLHESMYVPSLLNQVVIGIIRLKFKLGLLDDDDEDEVVPLKRSSYDLEANYDSINEDNTYLDNQADDFQNHFEADYDNALALVYFSLFFVSIFICSIELGIIYSILQVENENVQFSLIDNVELLAILVFGILFSLILSMLSIFINFQRFSDLPKLHTTVVWFGFVAVVISSVWSFVVFIQP